jgi:hypothetical protein
MVIPCETGSNHENLIFSFPADMTSYRAFVIRNQQQTVLSNTLPERPKKISFLISGNYSKKDHSFKSPAKFLNKLNNQWNSCV